MNWSTAPEGCAREKMRGRRARRDGAGGLAAGTAVGDVVTPSEVSVLMSPSSCVILFEGRVWTACDDYATSGLPGFHSTSDVYRLISRVGEILRDLPGAIPAVADYDDLGIDRDLVDTIDDRSHRDGVRLGGVPAVPLVGLPDIQQPCRVRDQCDRVLCGNLGGFWH